MRLQVRFRHLDASPELHRQVVRRIHFAFSRFAHAIQRITVTLADVNGPRGGVDKRCQVELDTDGNGKVVITAVARDWRSAIDNALARAARVLLRLWQRGRQPARATDRRAIRQPHALPQG